MQKFSRTSIQTKTLDTVYHRKFFIVKFTISLFFLMYKKKNRFLDYLFISQDV